MRPVPEPLAAHLAAGGVTTLCHIWRLTRRDGVVLAFTDHDRDLLIGGTLYAARTGLEAAEATAELGFAVGGGEVAGALSAAGITPADLAAGRYDDASVETWLLDWTGPEAGRLLLDAGTIGEVRQADDGTFVAELRGAMHRLDEERGRLYRATCSADLGDARCRVPLAAHTAEGTVARTDGALGLACGDAALAAFPDGAFTAGRLAWTGGANAGTSTEVKAHRAAAGVAELDLWQRAPGPIAVGDGFRVGAGCDKAFATCRDRFGNGANFRGFPHMPGNDFVVRLPRPGEPGLDGGSLFR